MDGHRNRVVEGRQAFNVGEADGDEERGGFFPPLQDDDDIFEIPPLPSTISLLCGAVLSKAVVSDLL